MGHDIGWWAFILAILTLFLAYPIDVLAHLTSPKVRDWWARRSRVALTKRVAVLEEKLEGFSQFPTFSEEDTQILWRLEQVGMQIGLATHIILSVLGGLTIIIRRSWPEGRPGLHPYALYAFGLLIVLGLAVNYWITFRLNGEENRGYRRARSAEYRKRLQTEIDVLKVKLASFH